MDLRSCLDAIFEFPPEVMASTDCQICSSVLMVRPVGFRANEQTAASNAFQTLGLAGPQIAAAAEQEFDALAGALRGAGVSVCEFPGRSVPETPDQLFPNNWLSLHEDGSAILYPMAADNRRQERRLDLLHALAVRHGFELRRIVDLTGYEAAGRFLEGTGSLVLDRRARVAYFVRSARTDAEVAADFCQRMGYAPMPFDAFDENGLPVYHTNVVMSVGEGFAVACLQAIADSRQRAAVQRCLEESDREVLEISPQQMHRFAGNLLQLRARSSEPVIVLSAAAHAALDDAQKEKLARHGRLLPVAVPTIEAAGGGSVRCMLAEIFLPGA